MLHFSSFAPGVTKKPRKPGKEALCPKWGCRLVGAFFEVLASNGADIVLSEICDLFEFAKERNVGTLDHLVHQTLSVYFAEDSIQGVEALESLLVCMSEEVWATVALVVLLQVGKGLEDDDWIVPFLGVFAFRSYLLYYART